MLRAAPRILFVPVSGQFGMGEYARSLAIARGCLRQWPQAQLHFALSRQAPYAAGVPFAATLLDSSPTFHTQEVIELMRQFRPTVVVFDNAGRTAQLRAARRQGAKVVYISARARQRRKAFRWRWLKLIDEHWIAYPEFIAGSLSYVERLKLKFRPEVRIRFLDVILSRDAGASDPSQGFEREGFLLMVPGGGTGHPGARDAVGQFLSAGRRLAQQGISTLCIGGGEASMLPHLRIIDSVPQPELARLLTDARLVVANGGSTLLQAITCGAPCIAVPIADDQRKRIELCEKAAVAIPAPLDADAITAAVVRLWSDESERRALAQRAKNLRLADGVQVALTGLSRLIESAGAGAASHA